LFPFEQFQESAQRFASKAAQTKELNLKRDAKLWLNHFIQSSVDGSAKLMHLSTYFNCRLPPRDLENANLHQEELVMNRAEFFEGLRGGALIALASAPFAALFGALARDQGMSLGELTLMSASVYAGASQLVGIELFGHQVQAWLIVLSILAVNFRHVLYSAAIARYVRHFTSAEKFVTFFLLVDPQFAEVVKRGEQHRPVTFNWYFGYGLAIYLPWVVVSFLGGLLGSLIGDPKSIGLDVLLPVYFLGIVISFRRRDNFLPVVVASGAASIAAFHVVGSPWHVSLGALAGILLAALMPPSRANRKPNRLAESHEV
jgi:predicted branched-subunit amino acid permease